VVFQSAADLLGTQQDTGVQQIFWSNYDRSKHIHTVHQLTKGNGPSQHPYAVEDRAFVAFESSATDLPGAFAPGGNQIYMARVDTEPVPDFPPVDQITQQSQFGSCSWPAVSPGTGDRVSFICSDDPTPLGTPGNRVYAYDLTQGKLFFVSFATDVQGPIAMNMGPWFVTMSTGFDLTGQGTCGRQLFLVD